MSASVLTGAKRRRSCYPDEEFITNDLAGQGSPTLPTYGAFTVWEGYLEARMPIMSDQPFAKSLDVDAGYRYSDYSLSFGSTNTWKVGLVWAPVEDVRFRTTYNVAVRAPNIQELYLQQRVQLDGTSDPCASPQGPGSPPPAASPAACANSGVSAAEYGKHRQQPGEPVQRPRRRQPELEARNRAYVDVRPRVHAAVPARVQRDRRLLRHQDREHHRHLRRQFDSWQLLEFGQPAFLQPGSSRSRHRDGFERLAVARHRRLHHRRHVQPRRAAAGRHRFRVQLSSGRGYRRQVRFQAQRATTTCT